MIGPGGSRVRIEPAVVRATLKAAGLRARHGLSQNFLADAEVLDAILAEAGPAPGERILEIGPGLGLLTGALLDSGAVVTAVELDRVLQRIQALRLSFSVRSTIKVLTGGGANPFPFPNTRSPLIANLPVGIFIFSSLI